MYSSEQRAQLRSELLNRGALDERISGGAITGSAAAACEDEWSDIDLAFGVGDGTLLPQVLEEWTSHLYEQYLAVHHVDTKFGAWIYRSFLLPTTLQVDLAFAPASDFGALGTTFQLVFGEAEEAVRFPQPAAASIARQCLPYVRCVQRSIANGEFWQADFFVSAIRDKALALACMRHGFSAQHGRGIHLLPQGTVALFEDSLAAPLCERALTRTLRLAVEGLARETRYADEALAECLLESLMAEEREKAACEVPALLQPRQLIGLGWLYAVHARSCISRQRLWQAEYMIRGARDSAIGLACIRCGIASDGSLRPDLLPKEVSAMFETGRVAKLCSTELSRAFRAVVLQLAAEVTCRGEAFAARLQQTLAGLSDSVGVARTA